MKAYVFSIGCMRNMLDDNLFRRYFQKNGCQLVRDPKEADFILFNTCAYCKERKEECLKTIKHMKKVKKQNSKLIVAGCFPDICPDDIKNIGDVLYFGPRDTQKLDDITCFAKPIGNFPNNSIQIDKTPIEKKTVIIVKNSFRYIFDKITVRKHRFERLFFTGHDQYGFDKNMFYINTSTGCLNNCSYCAIRLAKGKLVSRPINELVAEFRRGLKEGYTRFMLIAEDVGCYGQDMGVNLITLLDEMLKAEGKYKICFSNVHPKWIISMLDDFVNILESNRFDVLCMPIQSGSNKVLKMMKRGYTAEQIKTCISMLRDKVPNIIIKTHMMVGFPGESRTDFKRSMELLSTTDFDDVVVLKYSDMDNIESALYKDKIPEEVKDKRKREMELLAKKRRTMNKLSIFFNRR